jgi:hypothetical protein
LSGGRKGIGKTNFLNWYEENYRIKQIEVFEEDRIILAYLVGNIDSSSFLENVVKFVARVAEFRNWATRT